MNLREEKDRLKRVNERLQEEIERKKKEMKEIRRKMYIYQLYIQETYQQLEFNIWYEMKQHFYIERVEEPERCESPVPPEEMNEERDTSTSLIYITN